MYSWGRIVWSSDQFHVDMYALNIDNNHADEMRTYINKRDVTTCSCKARDHLWYMALHTNQFILTLWALSTLLLCSTSPLVYDLLNLEKYQSIVNSVYNIRLLLKRLANFFWVFWEDFILFRCTLPVLNRTVNEYSCQIQKKFFSTLMKLISRDNNDTSHTQQPSGTEN